MSLLLAVLLSWAPGRAAAEAPAKPFHEMAKADIDALIRKTYASTPAPRARLVDYSAGFVGVPYALFPLGVAPKQGVEDPAIRFDAADCTTMVETLMAMAFAADLDAATKNMARVRYRQGQVSLKSKNDVVETDWIPNNVAAGFLVDITSQVAGKETETERKKVRVRTYTEDEAKTLDEMVKADPAKAIEFLRNTNSLGKNFKFKKAALPYVPLDALPRLAARIPSGAIFSIVRESRADKEILVTHQGLIIQKADGTYVRHLAFKDKGVDVPLADFLKVYEKASWKVVGFNLTAVPEKP